MLFDLACFRKLDETGYYFIKLLSLNFTGIVSMMCIARHCHVNLLRTALLTDLIWTATGHQAKDGNQLLTSGMLMHACANIFIVKVISMCMYGEGGKH